MIASWKTCIFWLLIFSSIPVWGSSEEEAPIRLTLPGAVEIALRQNPGIINSGYNLDISRSNLRIAKNEYYPKLGTMAAQQWIMTPDAPPGQQDAYSRNIGLSLRQKIMLTGGNVELFSTMNNFDEPASGTAGLTTEETWSHSFGFRLDQPILRDAGPLVNTAPVRTSQLNLTNTEFDHILARRQLTNRVIGAFYRAMKSQRIVDVNSRALGEAETHLQHTRIKLEEGLVAQIDVSQAELQYAQRENLLITSQKDALEALDNLKILLNLNLNTSIEPSGEVVYRPEDIDEALAVDIALSERLELQRLRNNLEVSRLNVSTQKSRRLPDLRLAMQGGVSNEESDYSDVWKTDDPEYSLEFSLNYTFGDRSDREQYKQSILQQKKAENSLAELKQEVIREVTSAIRSYQSLKREIKILESSVKLAKYALDLANQSYTEGLIPNIDLLKAQDDLLAEETQHITKLMDFELAKATVLIAVGRDVDPADITLQGLQSSPDPGGVP